ncbi:MAG: hypothetical protein WCD43_07630 [Candidatus Acidiferrales bacterium]
MSLPLALVHPRKLFAFSVSSRVDQAQRRKLAQVNQRERYDGIERPFLCQGERVTARLKPCPDALRGYFSAPLPFAAQDKPFEAQGEKPCPDVTLVVQF